MFSLFVRSSLFSAKKINYAESIISKACTQSIQTLWGEGGVRVLGMGAMMGEDEVCWEGRKLECNM